MQIIRNEVNNLLLEPKVIKNDKKKTIKMTLKK